MKLRIGRVNDVGVKHNNLLHPWLCHEKIDVVLPVVGQTMALDCTMLTLICTHGYFTCDTCPNVNAHNR